MKFFQSKGYKVVSGIVYGWGATCVIIGALFKIMHFPGAGIVLTVGMLVEAFIFFFSAFEPQMEHYDWSRVFPQLGKGAVGSGTEDIPLAAGKGGNVPVLDGLEQSDIDELKRGIRRIAESADSFAGIAGQAPEVSRKMEQMAGTFGMLDNNTRKMSEAMEQSAKELEDGCARFGRAMTATGQEMTEKIRENCGKMLEGILMSGKYFTELGKIAGEQVQHMKTEGESYAGQMKMTVQHIAALNALYELQITEARGNMDTFRKVHGETNGILQQMAESRNSTVEFKEEAKKLTDKVNALNEIYGNMLSLINNN